MARRSFKFSPVDERDDNKACWIVVPSGFGSGDPSLVTAINGAESKASTGNCRGRPVAPVLPRSLSVNPGVSKKAAVPATPLAVFTKTSFLATKSVSQAR